MFCTVILIQLKLCNIRLSVFFVFNLAWLFTLTLFEFNLSVFPTLDMSVYLYLIGYLLMFNIIYIFSYLFFGNNYKSKIIDDCAIGYETSRGVADQKKYAIDDYLFIAWAIFVLVFVYQINVSYGFINYLSDGSARQVLLDINESDNSNINLSYYMFGTLYVLFRLVKWELVNESLSILDKIKISTIMISLLLTAAKMNFVYLCLMIYFISFLKRNKTYSQLLTHAFIIIFVFYIFIISFAFFTGKVIDDNIGSMSALNDVYDLGKATLLYPYNYLVGSLSAFNEFFLNKPNNEHSEFCSYMFSRFYQLMSIIINKEYLPIIPPHSAPFVNINGINTNVYTMHYHIVNDLGPFFAMIIAALQGIYFSWLDVCKRFFKNTYINVLFYLTLSNSILSLISFKFNDTMYIFTILLLIGSLSFDYLRRDNAK